MSEILREIEEELKRDRWLKLWRDFQRPILIGALALALGTAAAASWIYYDRYQTEAASSAFEIALTLRGQSKQDALEALVAQGGSYGVLAAFHEAAALAEQRRVKQAIAIYDDLSARIALAPFLRDLARINAASLLVGRASYVEIKERLEQAIMPDKPLRYSAREVLALAALSDKQYQQTRALLRAMLDDRNVPPTLAARAQIILDSLPPDPGELNPIDKMDKKK